jgi:hypothetical protein
LKKTPIESLGNLKSVGKFLVLSESPVKSLGNLEYVGGYLNLKGCLLSEITTEEEIRQQVEVVGKIFM